ncbi:hypothetical protein DFH09DRAFT_336664 [Mycena vulgaris]|nr:hypothetical protein DFH09DRAFT_336664 [Mycena vulgaris]
MNESSPCCTGSFSCPSGTTRLVIGRKSHSPSSSASYNGNPPLFFRNSVHRLFLNDFFGSTNDYDMTAILSACCGVTDLCVTIAFPPLNPVINCMNSLTRLAVELDDLFGAFPCDFTHSVFAHITHLEVYGAKRMDEISNGLALIPHLTHLAFTFLDLILKADQILQSCPRLQCLVFPVLHEDWGKHPQCVVIAAEDPRFVVTVRSPWREDWLCGSPFWARSEAFIALKRAGSIDRLAYFCV